MKYCIFHNNKEFVAAFPTREDAETFRAEFKRPEEFNIVGRFVTLVPPTQQEIENA